MRQITKYFTVFGLAALLVLSQSDASMAQRKGGRSRSGTVNRTNRSGQTHTGNWQGHRSWEKGKGYRSSQGNTSVTTDRGTWNNQRQNNVTRTGDNTYDRNWNSTTTGPNGNSRTWQGQGSGQVQRTDNGYTKTYEGTATGPKGQEYNIDKTATGTKTDDGWQRSNSTTVTDSQGNPVGTSQHNSTTSHGEDGGWQRNADTTVTNGAGNVVGSGQHTTTGGQGQGTETNGSWTGRNGHTTDYNSKWEYVDGQWVRTGTNSNGGSSTVTGSGSQDQQP